MHCAHCTTCAEGALNGDQSLTVALLLCSLSELTDRIRNVARCRMRASLVLLAVSAH